MDVAEPRSVEACDDRDQAWDVDDLEVRLEGAREEARDAWRDLLFLPTRDPTRGASATYLTRRSRTTAGEASSAQSVTILRWRLLEGASWLHLTSWPLSSTL